MARINWRSLDRWPANKPATPSAERKSGAAFMATYGTTLNDLEYELDQIEARDVVVEIDMEPRDLRLTGEPRASAATRSTPGIVLHFTNKDGRAVAMPCDRYRTWTANLRGLVLTLRALRAVDRYGATTSGEQYAGWAALPPAGGTTLTLSTNQAAELLERWSDSAIAGGGVGRQAILAHVDSARSAYRIALKRSHPDSMLTGGSNEKFTLVQEAGRILGAHHGAKL